MEIDWLHFTPWTSLAGGVLIGLAAALLFLLNGRIAGISGILGGLFRPAGGDIAWRISFLLGLVLAPAIYRMLYPLPAVQVEADIPLLISAGLLVGIGTRYGSGCTSGHGVCGLSRLSPRSLAATIAFMLAGFSTVLVARHLLS
ncbi:YeeE/YedE family protein [Noviherbaspirillum malthae]|uniref:YeeE/YedE family protein n=1 Tax=Noviherbaspirillum malthae TaxID=1260987 RepID=UPI0018901F4E|nr:YeeE/YedE family protein [Noviherbaspirillum malthae]